MITWLKYVDLNEVGAYLAAGWTISNDLATCIHGTYSCIMEWKGEGPPWVM